MVGKIKKWLGIDVLQRENLKMARSIIALRQRIKSDSILLENAQLSHAERIQEAFHVHATRIGEMETNLKAIEEPLNQCLSDGEVQVELDAKLVKLTSRMDAYEKQLTSEPAKTKIVPKPHRANWRTFRSAAEKASDEQKQEA